MRTPWLAIKTIFWQARGFTVLVKARPDESLEVCRVRCTNPDILRRMVGDLTNKGWRVL